MVRVSKAAGVLELTAPGWCLRFDSARPWRVQLSAGTGAPLADALLAGCADGAGSYDELLSVGPPALSRGSDGLLLVTLPAESSRWTAKRFVFACSESEVVYWFEVDGRGEVDAVQLWRGRFAADVRLLDLGSNHLRAPYRRPYGDCARGTTWLAQATLSQRPNGAEHDVMRPWDDCTVDFLDRPERDDGLDSFLPAPFAFCFDLGPGQPFSSVGLALEPDHRAVKSFSLRGGESSGFEVALEPLQVDGTWRSPSLIWRANARDEPAALRAQTEALANRGLLPTPARPVADWHLSPVFDGRGEQAALARGHAATEQCRQDVYTDALRVLARAGLTPGQVWIGPGWNAAGAAPFTGRWPDLPGFIAGCHDRDQRVLLNWDLTSHGAEGEFAEQARSALSPAGLNADGLVLAPVGWPSLSWLIARLWLLTEVIAEVKPGGLLVSPTVNPYLTGLVGLLDTGGLWSDRASVLGALHRRAAIGTAASGGAPLAIADRHAPSREAWREVIAAAPALGVPVLSYSRSLDLSGEPLETEEYDLVQRAWQQAARRANP